MNKSDIKLSLTRIVAAGCIFIGGLVVLLGMIWLGMTAAFVMRAAKAPGTVVEVERVRSSRRLSKYYPIFTFADASGIVHTQRTFGASYYEFEPGEKVTVLYDSAMPKHSRIDTFHTVWYSPLLVTGLGFFLGGFGLFLLSPLSRIRSPRGVEDKYTGCINRDVRG